jgi:subfamily B ATP-binding cassette protein HlyB/CyaB
VGDLNEPGPPLDTAAAALAFLMRLIGVPAETAEILHRSGKPALEGEDLLRAARRFPVKARLILSDPERLQATSLPALARLKSGAWVVVGALNERKVLIQDPRRPEADALDLAEFIELWDRRLLLVARRAALGDAHQRFGIVWFVAAMRKHRRPLTEVLAASFFVQLFGLLAPLFFQVIIDKVFVHRGLSTLEVLAIGMGALSVFEVLLGGVLRILGERLVGAREIRIQLRLGGQVITRRLTGLDAVLAAARSSRCEGVGVSASAPGR